MAVTQTPANIGRRQIVALMEKALVDNYNTRELCKVALETWEVERLRLQARLNAFATMTLAQRLVWLFTGRV